MRKIMTWGFLVCLCLFAVSGIVAAFEPPQGGKVSAVSDASKTFTLKWKTKESSYRTSAETTYLIGEKKATWSDLKVGDEVTVTYHLDGKDRVADKVSITGFQPLRT